MIELQHISEITRAIRNAWPVGDTAIELIRGNIERCLFGKRRRLVSKGKAEGKAYFLQRGMTRSYWLIDGEEITTSFSTEGAIVFSMDELYYGQLSEEYVETVEQTEAYAIRLDTLHKLVSENIELANWWRVIHQREYRRIHRSHMERLSLSAQERYREFSRQFPDVCRRARLCDISSYLGITPSTLSHIRNKLSYDK